MSSWHGCHVRQTGVVEDGRTLISLREDSGSAWTGDRWFVAVETARREMLAVALTAITTDMQVSVQLTSTAAEGGVCERLYLNR